MKPHTLPAGEHDASALRGLEPYGGNMYRPHLLQVNRGRFWRCAHGTTGIDGGEFVGCARCAAEDPEAFSRWDT